MHKFTDPCGRVWRLALSVCCALMHLLPQTSMASTLKVLILSGQNNHDWAETTPRVKEILLKDGRFEVEVTNQPEKLEPADLEKFDALLSNWNNWGNAPEKDWPEALRQAFLDFVRNGRGLVVVHAGSSSFQDWEDYQNLVGGTWGKDTGHGPIHTFEVRMTERDHPITRGMKPFSTRDELWHGVPLRNATVLTTAFSAVDNGGSGKDEPVAFVTQFGKGGCFNLVLGHDAAAMQAAGFQLLLRRGTEWAASGAVTIPPQAAADPAIISAAAKAAATYDFGDSRAALLNVESVVAQASDPQSARVTATALAEQLKAAETTTAAKQFFCGQLSLVATSEQVPAVAPLLRDAAVFDHSLLVLQRIPGNEARRAIIDALGQATALQKTALLMALGARQETGSLETLTRYANAPEESVRTAAARAAAMLNTPGAASPKEKLEEDFQSSDANVVFPALAELKKPSNREALMRIAAKLESLPAEKQVWVITGVEECGMAGALPFILKSLRSTNDEVKRAALSAVGTLGDADCIAPLMEALANATPGHAQAIATALSRLPGNKVDAALAAQLGKGGANTGPIVVKALAARNPPDLPKILAGALASETRAVRIEAARGLAAGGGSESIPPLLRALRLTYGGGAAGEESNAGEAAAIESALAEICRRENRVDPLLKAYADAEGSMKLALLNVAAAVGGREAAGLLERETRSPSNEVALAAVRALSDWQDPAVFKTLGDVAAQTSDARTRTLALRGMTRLAPQVKEQPDEAAAALERVLPRVTSADQEAILKALGELPAGAGLGVLAKQFDGALGIQARLAALNSLEKMNARPNDSARAVLTRLRAFDSDAGVVRRLELLDWKFSELPNLALGAAATSPTGLKPDGQGGPAPAAIDGDHQTYWDEVDNQSLYVLRVSLKERARVRFLRICGWQHQQYAPKDFAVLCDGKTAAKIQSAQYEENWLTVGLDGTECQVVELRITGYYASSPAIRELEIRGEPLRNPSGK